MSDPAFLDHVPATEDLPVDSWNPPFCGDIDMHITADGQWFYQGTPIARPEMVRLFSRLLRREKDAYFLVTPVEKVGITVADVPFIAAEMTMIGDGLNFRTQVGDTVTADAQHPLRFDTSDGFKPYILVRSGLEARLTRALAQDLAARIEVHPHAERDWFGIMSSGVFFPAMVADPL